MSRCSIALLGGIGSGKSTVGHLLRPLGAEVVDSDRIGHAVLAGPALEAVAARWPEVVVEGAVDRAALAQVVFSDPDELRELEAITHPLIGARISELADDSEAEYFVVELPVLRPILRGRWRRVVVDAPDEVRLDRVVERGLSRREAVARMNSQPSRVEWLAVADFVIDNSGDPDDLEHQVSNLLRFLEDCSEPGDEVTQ